MSAPPPGSIPAPPSAQINTEDIAKAVTAAASVAVTAPSQSRSPPPIQADYGPSPVVDDPCPSPDTDPTHRFFYFGYGSNMLPAQLLLKKVHVHSARRGILRDVQLLFDLATTSIVEPSYANLKRHPAGSGYATHGILYELEARDQQTMDRVEGNGLSYVREPFPCELYPEEAASAEEQLPEGSVTRSEDGTKSIVITQAYICHANNLSRIKLRDTPPSRRYLNVILTGARHHKLDSAYISWLESRPYTPLPVLQFTEEQRLAMEAREFTEEQLAAGGWKPYMEHQTPATWKDPLLMTLKGIVFDARHSSYSNAWKQHNGGRCLTMFTAGRVATDGVSLPESLSDLTKEHHDYVNATVVDWARTYPIVGHMADRQKYDF